MSDEKKPKRWQKLKIFNTYDEAAAYKSQLAELPGNENLEIKIRRCGPGGTSFKVKSWDPPQQRPNNKQ